MQSFDEIRDNICTDLLDYHGSVSPVMEDEATRIIMASPTSGCKLDEVLTLLLKEYLSFPTKSYQYSQSIFTRRIYSTIFYKRSIIKTLLRTLSRDPDNVKITALFQTLVLFLN